MLRVGFVNIVVLILMQDFQRHQRKGFLAYYQIPLNKFLKILQTLCMDPIIIVSIVTNLKNETEWVDGY